MKKELLFVKEKIESLMGESNIHERIAIANWVNDWAFESCQSGALSWEIARRIEADALDNETNMQTWHLLTTLVLNADILLR